MRLPKATTLPRRLVTTSWACTNMNNMEKVIWLHQTIQLNNLKGTRPRDFLLHHRLQTLDLRQASTIQHIRLIILSRPHSPHLLQVQDFLSLTAHLYHNMSKNHITLLHHHKGTELLSMEALIKAKHHISPLLPKGKGLPSIIMLLHLNMLKRHISHLHQVAPSRPNVHDLEFHMKSERILGMVKNTIGLRL
jgi:hypothetical protein